MRATVTLRTRVHRSRRRLEQRVDERQRVGIGCIHRQLVWPHHRSLGLAFIAGAVAFAWARIAAHVRHLQDVAAGALFGALVAVLASLLVAPLLIRLASSTQSAPRSPAEQGSQRP